MLPFAGLEMALLGWALKVACSVVIIARRSRYTDEAVEIEELHHADASRIVFPRYWAQVKIRAGDSPLHPSRLTIESHGRRCEVGSFLNEQERRVSHAASGASSGASTSRRRCPLRIAPRMRDQNA